MSWYKQAPFFPLVYSTHGDWHDGLVLCNDASVSFNSAIQRISLLHLVLIPIITPALENPSSFSDFYDFSTISSYSPELRSNPIVGCMIKASATTLHSAISSRWDTNDEDLGVDLVECLQLYTQHGNLDENNKWYCPHCQDHMCAESVTRVDKLPEILILQLERFEYTQNGFAYGYGGGRRKISTLVRFPIHDLNMQPWLHDSTSIPAEDTIYDLTAICNHSGSSSGGHYYCYARDENDGYTKWYEYNDSGVYEKGEDGLVRDTAYVLFYQRRHGRVSSQDVCEKVKTLHEEYIASHPKETPSNDELQQVNVVPSTSGNGTESMQNRTTMETKWWCDSQRMDDLSLEDERTNEKNLDDWTVSSSLDRSSNFISNQCTQKPVEVTIPRETSYPREMDLTPIEVVIDDEVKPDPVLKQGADVYLTQQISSNAEPALSDSDDLYIWNVYSQTYYISNTSIWHWNRRFCLRNSL